jgi:hypothetical protein
LFSAHRRHLSEHPISKGFSVMRTFLAFLLAVFVFSGSVLAQQITGDYVETRNADVYTGHCFANAESGLVGNTAILGWHIRNGGWQGVALNGLSVAAVIRAQGTLGDPYSHPFPAQAVLIVDVQATTQQQKALVSFVQYAGGELTAQIVRVESAPVELAIPSHGVAMLRAGYDITVKTRALNHGDHLCGNEETYYPPLTGLAHFMPVVAVTDEYRGDNLGMTWELHGKRSAFVGAFAVPVSEINKISASR